MRVRMLVSTNTMAGYLTLGEVVEVDSITAERWLRYHLAEAQDADTPESNSADAPERIDASASNRFDANTPERTNVKPPKRKGGK